MTDSEAANLKASDRVRLDNIAGTVLKVEGGSVLIQWDDWPYYPDRHSINGGLAAVQSMDDWKSRYEEEYKIVDRVWRALGINTIAEAKGKTIDELVTEAVEKAWRYDELSK